MALEGTSNIGSAGLVGNHTVNHCGVILDEKILETAKRENAAIIGLSLVVVTGYAGQVSLAQLALAGAGAYTLSFLTVSWGIPFPIAPILAAAFATLVGVLGIPICVIVAFLGLLLAGRLSLEQIPLVAGCQPDAVAVRSAVCVGGRLGRVDQLRVALAADHCRRAGGAGPIDAGRLLQPLSQEGVVE